MVKNVFNETKIFSGKVSGSIFLPRKLVLKLLGNPMLVYLAEEQPAPCAGQDWGPRHSTCVSVLLCQGSLAASGVWDRDALMAAPLPARPTWAASCSSLISAAGCPPYGKGGKDRGIPIHTGLESGRNMQGAGKWELGNAHSSCCTDRRPGT